MTHRKRKSILIALNGKTFSNENQIPEFVENFFTLKILELYPKDLEELPDKWQQVTPIMVTI